MKVFIVFMIGLIIGASIGLVFSGLLFSNRRDE